MIVVKGGDFSGNSVSGETPRERIRLAQFGCDETRKYILTEISRGVLTEPFIITEKWIIYMNIIYNKK